MYLNTLHRVYTQQTYLIVRPDSTHTVHIIALYCKLLHHSQSVYFSVTHLYMYQLAVIHMGCLPVCRHFLMADSVSGLQIISYEAS